MGRRGNQFEGSNFEVESTIRPAESQACSTRASVVVEPPFFFFSKIIYEDREQEKPERVANVVLLRQDRVIGQVGANRAVSHSVTYVTVHIKGA